VAESVLNSMITGQQKGQLHLMYVSKTPTNGLQNNSSKTTNDRLMSLLLSHYQL